MERPTSWVAFLLLGPLWACGGLDTDARGDAGDGDATAPRDAGRGDATPPRDAGGPPDAASIADAGSPPSGPLDGSVSPDSGPPPDAGSTDAGGGQDAGSPLVIVTDGGIHHGRACLRIETPAATYLYDRAGAGFTSLRDRDGHEWIGWRPGGGSSGEYRGIPNMGRCCHPGYEGATTLVSIEEHDFVRIESSGVTGGESWRVTWDFTPEHATLTVHDAPGRYYLLYEGTPGGAIGPEDYFVTSEGAATMTSIYTAEELITADMAAPEWIYFADGDLGRGLLLVHHEDDDVGERYWTMERAMTVFGFGRTAMGGSTGLSATPQHMTIALLDDIDFARASAAADEVLP